VTEHSVLGDTAHRIANRIADGRSFLFVPGDRPERFAKAIASGADAVILDLEDAVPPERKSAAREAVRVYLRERYAHGVPVLVRINAASSAWFQADIDAMTETTPDALMVPKAESADAFAALARALPGVPLVPLVESARGLVELHAIALAPGVARLALGHIDFIADVGMSPSDEEAELTPLRFALAVASRAAGLPPPIDGVTVAIDDPDRLHRDAQRARRLGFTAKLCIHPRQISALHAALRPGDDAIAWARRVIAADAAAGGAAFQLDGRMVDAPVVLQARRIAAQHARYSEEDSR